MQSASLVLSLLAILTAQGQNEVASQAIVAGMQKGKSDDPQGAIACFDRALVEDPHLAPVYAYRGIEEGILDQLGAAKADFTRALKENPTYAFAQAKRGGIRKRMGDFSGALADDAAALRILPREGQIYCDEGYVYLDIEDLPNAHRAFERAIDLSPAYAPGFNGRAQVAKDTGKLEDAIDAINHESKLGVPPRDLLIQRAMVEQELGRDEDARRDYQQAFVLPVPKHGKDDNADFGHLLYWVLLSQLHETEAARRDLSIAFAGRLTSPGGNWPARLAGFLMGAINEQEMTAEAGRRHDDAELAAYQKCHCWYYEAEKRLLSGDRTGARLLFQKCVQTGMVTENEYILAAIALKN